jgi:hypothetical protein
MDVGIRALTAGVMPGQVQIAEPQPTQPTDAQAPVVQPGDDHDVTGRREHSRHEQRLDHFIRQEPRPWRTPPRSKRIRLRCAP